MGISRFCTHTMIIIIITTIIITDEEVVNPRRKTRRQGRNWREDREIHII